MNTPLNGRSAPAHVSAESHPIIGLLVTNAADRRLLTDFLHQEGYGVHADAPNDVTLADWNGTSLVIVDEQAAWQRAPELARLKAQSGAFLPVLVAIAKQSESPPWLRAGFDDVLRLPIRKADLAARIHANLRLREQSQEQYREIFENAPIGIYRAAPEGRILIMNPALIQMLGYASFDEFASDAQHPDKIGDLAPVYFKEMLVQASEGGRVEVTLPRRDQSSIVVRTNATALHDDEGAVVAYEGTIENVTAEKRAAQALLNSEEQFRTVWEIAADAMALSDPNGIVLAANTAYYRLYLLTPDQVLGKEFCIIFPEPLRTQMMELYKQVFHSSEAFETFESLVLRGDGTERTVETHIDFVINHGQRIAMVSSIRDITQRKQADAELLRAKSELEERVAERTLELREANVELHRLTRRVVQAQEAERKRLSRELHDEIGQALTAVSFNLQAYQQPVTDPSKLSHLHDSLSIIETTLQQVRDLSLDLHPSILDDLGLGEAVRWYLGRQAERGGFEGTLVAEPKELKLPAELNYTCFRITQEALTNVLRHAHANKVRVELRQSRTELDLLIRDDGVGFHVVDARRRAGRSASLGLVGMRERVQLVNGSLQIKSTPGSGTEIHARFPLTAAPVTPLGKSRKGRRN